MKDKLFFCLVILPLVAASIGAGSMAIGVPVYYTFFAPTKEAPAHVGDPSAPYTATERWAGYANPASPNYHPRNADGTAINH